MKQQDHSKKVYLMGTCLIDNFYPDAGMDAVELLNDLGYEVIFPQDQTCCGQPAYNSGYDDQARQVAKVQLKAFAEDIPVLVMMGSCAAMQIECYPKLFNGSPDEEQAVNLAKRTWEFGDFLFKKLNFKPVDKGEKSQVALHVSCSSRRSLRIADSHQELIKALTNVELVEFKNQDECCGFGGTFAVKQPVISAAMATDKANAIAETGCDTLVSADCGCLMNIAGTMEKNGQAIQSKHLATFLKERVK